MTEFQPRKQHPEEVAEGLRAAFRQAKKDGVMDATPYLKQMNKIDSSHILQSGDYIYYHGIKYQKVVEPNSFYNKLWDLLKTKLNDTLDCDELTDEVMNLIKDNIPKPYEVECPDEPLEYDEVEWDEKDNPKSKTIRDVIDRWWMDTFTSKNMWSVNECIDDLADQVQFWILRNKE